MEIFELGEDGLVVLNKPLFQLVPELQKIYARDRGSKGDSDGRKKYKARREYTFIYFYSSFSSPIREWEPEPKHKEALYYAGLPSVDAVVLLARDKYEEWLIKGTRSLRTYNNLLKTLDAFDKYFGGLDFTATDKKGELLHNPDSVGRSIERLDKVYAAIENFKKRVEAEMKAGGAGIRGTAELGDNEATDNTSAVSRRKEWSELDIQEGSVHEKARPEVPAGTKADFADIMHAIQQQSREAKVDQSEIDSYPEDLN